MIDTSRRRLPYVVIDVFTDRPLEGNSLAIFTDARGLSTEQMQALAREMNLAESTFILPREIEEERRSGTRVRIFTVQEELPFAGHPTLGTAYFLHRFGGSNEIWLDLNIGKIAVHFRQGKESENSFGEMRQRDPEAGENFRRAVVRQPARVFDPGIMEKVSCVLRITNAVDSRFELELLHRPD